MMMTEAKVHLCPDCHHRPSMRTGDPAYCYCRCHDIADAAPDLLKACRQMVIEAGRDGSLRDVEGYVGLIEAYVLPAIAKADGR